MTGGTLCLDAGTTLIKAVVFDDGGKELVTACRPAPVQSPRPGYSEQEMNVLWEAVVEAMTDAVAGCGVPIVRIAITAQGDGAWLVDANVKTIRPAILWNDGRSRDIVDLWQHDGTLAKAFAINGSLTNMGLPNAILRSLLAEDPQSLDPARWVLTCGSWLFAQLTGVVGLHVSEASAPWLDIAELSYSEPLLELYGLSDYSHLIPPLLDSASSVQPLAQPAASAIGIAAGTLVVLAPYDVLTAAAGSGATAAGDAFCILGTTLCTGMVTNQPETGTSPGGLTLAVMPDGGYVRAFPTLAGTGVIDWMTDLLGLTDPSEFSALAAGSPPAANGVAVWPYLSPAGERAPFLDPDARGVIAGLSFSHDRHDLARASIEGLAHVIGDCLDAMPARPRTLALAGGGAASDLWCSIIADVTGLPSLRPSDGQVGAKGALVHAAAATGEYGSIVEAAESLVSIGRRFDPHDSLRDLHSRRHSDFLDSRRSFSEHWSAWAAFGRGGPDAG